MRIGETRTIVHIALVMLLLGLVPVYGQDTFVVPPSGVDDTQALQDAFDDAVAAGPGSTVRLEAGTYCVKAPVIIRGFDGSWVGAGKGVTIVETCRDPFPVPMLIDADPSYPLDPQMSIRQPFTFIEVEGKPSTSLEIADLTLRIKGTTNPYFRHGNCGGAMTIHQYAISLFAKRPTVFDGEVSDMAFRADRIEIIGEANGLFSGAPSPINIITGIVLSGGREVFEKNCPGDFSERRIEPVRADVSLTRSHMEHAGIAIALGGLDSRVSVGGSPPEGNTFDVILEAMRVVDMSRSTVVYSHNSGRFEFGPIVLQGVQAFFGLDAGPQGVPLPEPSQFVIAHNDFHLASFLGPGVGIAMVDYPVALLGAEAKTADVLVAWNDIDAGRSILAVDGFAVADCLVQYNRIEGEYLAGMALGYSAPPGAFTAVGCTLQGNNLQKATVRDARIVLGPFSRDNLVVGGSNEINVLDLGVDNIITGVNNNQGDAPGPALQEALERRREFLSSLRGW